MKIAAIISTAFIVATVQGAEIHSAQTKLIVCMERGATFGVDLEAQAIASKIFARIGVAIEWRRGLRNCPSQAILISLSHNTPDLLKPGALAQALPFEGARIKVFYDRIALHRPQVPVAALLAHVLAHEIGHILQGTDRHSGSGVMKGQWDGKDFSQMSRKLLMFEDWDIQLIHAGLEERGFGRIQGAQPLASKSPGIPAKYIEMQ